NVDDLSRDVDNANGSINPIFDKEKEQNRLKEAQLIGEIGGQAMDIARTQGKIIATNAANERMKNVTPEDIAAAEKQWKKANPDKVPTAEDINNQIYQTAYNQAFNESGLGTGGAVQRAMQAATAAVQGLSGGNMAAALANGAAPYITKLIADTLPDDPVSRTLAHAAVNAALAAAQGNSALVGAGGAVTGELIGMIAINAYGKPVSELSETEKQTVSALATLAAGLAGGLIGDSTADTVAGAQTGKTVVENNSLHDIIDNKTSGVTQEQKYQNAQKELVAAVEEFKAQNCAGLSADVCSAKISEHRDELLKGAIGFGIDFVPIIGDIKSVAEAQSTLDYLIAVIGFIPGAGDVAGKAIKAAEAALKKGDVAEASKLLNKASDEIQSVKALDVGSYKDLKKGEVVGDGLEHDHIPSFAALRKAKENELGRKLTPAEEKNLYQNATAVEVPKDAHQSGPTYGGKNTAAQVQQDALDLCGAVCRDTDALRNNMIERGYDPKQVDDAIKQIIDRNHQTGVIK
uniref:VENN motif pre-toxin domain-containing protein n=1 Tax=Yersinia aleksiciae TaxID=263819 RepID=UPI0021BDD236